MRERGLPMIFIILVKHCRLLFSQGKGGQNEEQDKTRSWKYFLNKVVQSNGSGMNFVEKVSRCDFCVNQLNPTVHCKVLIRAYHFLEFIELLFDFQTRISIIKLNVV